MAPLLALRSGRDDPPEPPWLTLCGVVLRHPHHVVGRDTRLAELDPDAQALNALAAWLKSNGADDFPVLVQRLPPGVAERALAMAHWAQDPTAAATAALADPTGHPARAGAVASPPGRLGAGTRRRTMRCR